MSYRVIESRSVPGEWFVEPVAFYELQRQGAAKFYGPNAKERAEEYAAWKSFDERRQIDELISSSDTARMKPLPR